MRNTASPISPVVAALCSRILSYWPADGFLSSTARAQYWRKWHAIQRQNEQTETAPSPPSKLPKRGLEISHESQYSSRAGLVLRHGHRFGRSRRGLALGASGLGPA